MALVSFLVCLLSCFIFSASKPVDPYPYEVGYFENFVDHFNEVAFKNQTFKQKYLYSDKHWKSKSGPVFFYTGNEGPIEGFWKASGFVHELASDMGAAVVFAEHRFYGSSLPFGNKSFDKENLGVLSIDQALADYATLISKLLETSKCVNCKVITFGGSYGGMLAAYMRFKYPNLIHGALASSAPIYMQDPIAKRDFFFPQVTEVFLNADSDKFCRRLSQRVFNLTEIFPLASITKLFNLCQPLKDQNDFRQFQGWLRNVFVMLAMMDYPYPTDFFGQLPGHPVEVACKTLTTAHNPIFGLRDLAGIYYNSSKNLHCFNLNEEYVECADPTGCGVGPDATAWDYQACTEIWLPDSSNGVTDMFPNLPWTEHMRAEYCLKKFGVLPRHDWSSIQFWGENIQSTSNIIFSNGDMDPWRGGGVLQNVSDSIIAINVRGGAHHLDLRASNKADPNGVTEAREKEKAIIQEWLNETTLAL